jgi:ATP-binding cassette subfamily F protein 3
MILACNHIEKKFNDEALFSDVSFHINEHECTALVGVNGTGKTTLLRIIVGELPADNGDVILAKDTSVGYLPQQQGYHSDKSIYDELWEVKKDIVALEREIRTMEETMQTASGEELNPLLERYHRMQTEFEAKDGYACKSQIMGIINGLGFVGNDIDKSINTLSGGQKTRVALGKLLLLEPDLLILDEPTNHLDLASIQWLETYLSNYKGSVLIVSHDRYFLDRIADKVVELDHGKATVFKGNYSDYAQKKELLRRDAIKQYENYQQTVRHQEQVIEKLRSFNREKSIKRAESRQKMLEKMTPVDKPVSEQKSMHFSLVPEKESGKDVLRVENFGKSFGDLHLFQGVSFELFRGERVALIGKNGTGKTTLLKMLCELESPDQGTAVFGTNVELGYYDQEHNVLHEEKTIFDEIHDDYPDLNNTKIRNVLAAFLFTGEDVYKKISLLSGGEKILIPRAEKGNEKLTAFLAQAGAVVEDVPTYQTLYEKSQLIDEKKEFETGQISCAVFTSASTVKGFVEGTKGLDYSKVKAACIGRQTKAAAESFGMKAYMSEKATIDSLVKLVEDMKRSE